MCIYLFNLYSNTWKCCGSLTIFIHLCLSSHRIVPYVNMYRPRRNPLFFVDIMAEAQGVRYSTPLQNFVTVLVSLFDKGIQACQNVPQLEKVCYCAFVFHLSCFRAMFLRAVISAFGLTVLLNTFMFYRYFVIIACSLCSQIDD